MEAEWHRQHGDEVYWEKISEELKYKLPYFPFGEYDYAYQSSYPVRIYEPEGIPFLSLPSPDRIFTKAHDKRYQQNGNFKYLPGTYIQSAFGCWWGKCEFCVEKRNNWQVRPVDDVFREIMYCKSMGFREVFDDSGTFPTGKWLDDLLSHPNPGIPIGCNMRMVNVDYERMKDWGFRMLLFGIESAKQGTLDRINKGVKVEDVKHIIRAAKAGLEPHASFMFGYPWETEHDALNTLELAHYLLRNGYLKTAQASFYMPPDGRNNESHRKYVKQIYHVAKYPDFWINKLRDIKSWSDVKYLFRQIKEGLNG